MQETVRELADARAIANEVYNKLLSSMQYPLFGIGSVPIDIVAKVFQKDPTWVREGIEKGWLPIGICTQVGGKRRNFYISPKKLWELTGYVWKGEENSNEQ